MDFLGRRARIPAFGRDFGLRPKFRPPAEIFFSYREFPNFVKKTPTTNPRPKCIGGFHYRENLQKIVSMPFWKANYVFKTILKIFFFFFFEIFEKKKHSCSRKSTHAGSSSSSSDQ